MENEHLRAAITRAGLTLEEFADIVGVDVKTVQRWLRGRTPYAGNRATVAAALDTPEHALWPDVVPPSTESSEHGQPIQIVTDVVAGYGYATDHGVLNPAAVLRPPAERIELIVPDVSPEIIDLLRAKSAEGCQVRAIIEDLDEQVEPLVSVDGIEIRASTRGGSYGLYRADEQILLTLRRIGAPSEPPPLILVRRRTSRGLFDRLADDFEERWEQATPLPTRERLHAHLHEVDVEATPDPDAVSDPSPPLTPNAPHADAPRRWPGRRP